MKRSSAGLTIYSVAEPILVAMSPLAGKSVRKGAVLETPSKSRKPVPHRTSPLLTRIVAATGRRLARKGCSVENLAKGPFTVRC